MSMINATCDLPWRIHWNLRGGDPGPYLDAVRDCQPLSMTVEVDDPERLRPLGLPWPNTAVVAVFHGWKAFTGVLPDAGIVRWEFPVESPAQAGEVAERYFRDLSSERTAFRWIPAEGTLKRLVRLLEICVREGCGLTLPNRPVDGITAGEKSLMPDMKELDKKDLEDLKAVAAQLGEDRLRVHDFIISAAMGMEGPEPLGCEAGNSLAYLDTDGAIYPCSSLLVRMGDLSRESLAAVWAKPIRSRIRKDVSILPAVCSGCSVLERCRGGCRGIVYHLKGHFGAPDVLCSEGREGQE